MPNYDPASYADVRFTQPGTVNGKLYAMHKDWGTTGYCVNTKKVTEKMTRPGRISGTCCATSTAARHGA